jgi:hypothetical protein
MVRLSFHLTKSIILVLDQSDRIQWRGSNYLLFLTKRAIFIFNLVFLLSILLSITSRTLNVIHCFKNKAISLFIEADYSHHRTVFFVYLYILLAFHPVSVIGNSF